MSEIRLTRTTLDRAALRPRVLHLGFGAFGRALPIWTLDRGLTKAGGDFGVIAARLNSGAEELSALEAQDGLFHVAAADGHSAELREIGCVIGTLHPKRDGTDAIPDLIAQPDFAAVFVTITEKGYGQSHGHLDRNRADISADLQNPHAPGSAIGVLVEGLRRRRAAGLGGITIMSCDNIPENGVLLAQLLDDFAREIDAGLADWIAAEVATPSSMVDRITPAMDADGCALIREGLGHDDPAAIVTEPFSQWVLEDRFAGPRLPLAEGGATLVKDVTPFEHMKLRMLNGAHTFLAHAGRLAGHATVADCIGDEALRHAALRLMRQEAAPTLDMPPGTDLDAYANALIARFGNSRLRHRLDQIAQDTSQKIPQRLIAPSIDNLAAGRETPISFIALASWIAALRDLPEVADPRASELRKAAASADPVASIFGSEGIIPVPKPLIEPIRTAFQRVTQSGILATLREVP